MCRDAEGACGGSIRTDTTSTRDSVKPRILIADDDKDMLDVLAFKLTQAGFEVECVGDGLAALESIESNPPRLAILDLMMSGLSGLDVLRKVRANEATKNLDVILLTGRTADSDVDAAFECSAEYRGSR